MHLTRSVPGEERLKACEIDESQFVHVKEARVGSYRKFFLML